MKLEILLIAAVLCCLLGFVFKKKSNISRSFFTVAIGMILLFGLGFYNFPISQLLVFFVLGVLFKNRLPGLSHLFFVLLGISLFWTVIGKFL